MLTVPEVFDQREEDGIVTLLQDEPGAELLTRVREAVAMCPTGAITLIED